ncbi:MAG: L-glutamate gamma-semialdehyde dehydrogenase [Planctomycetota bacterium]
MDRKTLESTILSHGKNFFSLLSEETPSVFNTKGWVGKVMDWSMSHEDFKIQLFRFIDVLPYLTNEEMLHQHIQEYFGRADNVPTVLKWGAKGSGLAGKLGMKMLGATIRKSLEMMALQFIIGGNEKESVKNLKALHGKKQFAFTLDILGEATVNEKEAEEYVNSYLDLLDELGATVPNWKPLGNEDGPLDWSDSPIVNVSVKPSALFSQSDPENFEGTVEAMLSRLKSIYRKVIETGGYLCIDMEMQQLKEVTLELYRRLRSDAEFRDYPHLGFALQCYLKSCDEDLNGMIAWAQKEQLPISIRLVKGAYWDYEIVQARQKGWEIPVYTIKAESDAAFERCTETIFRNHEICHFACASHNIRSVSAVIALAEKLNVPKDRYEFQALFGMAEPFRKALQRLNPRVRLYCPHGKLLPGMAYLIRRLLENTSNESFLKQTFVDKVDQERLLESPLTTLERSRQQAAESASVSADTESFRNEPVANSAKKEVRQAFVDATDEVRGQLNRTYPLYIAGEDVMTDDRITSVNPAAPDEIVGNICQGGTAEVEQAIQAAKKAFVSWQDVPVRERAEYLVKAAEIARKRAFELSAWQILECGKQWQQAYNDVAEAIDFLEYYAKEMIRLSEPQYLGQIPGETNEYFYQPKGLTAVIGPWNFPLAISCGMCAAAIVAGNCVIYKPSNLSPVIGYNLVELFKEAGLPEGVFNYVPGRGSVMGDYLVDHPDISVIAFTGSMEVGLRIVKRAGKTHPNQTSVKKVISEMGGKNAIIVDDDADLDEVVPQLLDSAFKFQGQKCSACSRVIVLDAIYDRFIDRLIEGAKSLKIGPAEDPANFMGPVIDSSSQKTIQEYIEIGKQEGHLVYSCEVPSKGYYVPLTIIDRIRPEHQLAQEEIFGPVLAVMRVKDFDQAIEWANSTRFALTGAVFSRSPEHLEKARRQFRVGNLYLNRGSTGALVMRQPFGGFKMSGVGTKAGGQDYLLHFMDPRAVTENTMRRGFVPIRSDDQWV